jgi:hypothetical protein
VTLRVRPIELRDANAFVAAHHRHHTPVVGHRFSLAVYDEAGVLHGVAICGRPVSASVDPLAVLEVTRLCTDGVRNCCSILYAASARAAQAIGYDDIQTYILEGEVGTSLRAAGWVAMGLSRSRGHWHGRAALQPEHLRGPKQRWARHLQDD